MIRKFATAIAISSLSATAAFAQYSSSGPTTTYTPPASASAGQGIDFANAKPMPLPKPSSAVPLPNLSTTVKPAGTPGFSPGKVGTGKLSPVQLAPARADSQLQSATPQEYGTSNVPYTTSRVNAYGQQTSLYYPNSATGKLFFTIPGQGTFVCSASMIKPGLAVTAAHCVANYGQNQYYSNWQFAPAYNNGSAPYGIIGVKNVTLLTAYLQGTDNCYQSGVICPDDVAVLNLLTPNGLPGNATGTYGYGWDGYGFNGSNQALINQLGYPQALDSGTFMQRNDSQGVKNSTYSNNTLIGSLMTGGSSGGPWLVNLGRPPLLNGVNFGAEELHNIVVGVTSWGWNDATVKQQGASSFTSGNIVTIVNAVCAANPGKC